MMNLNDAFFYTELLDQISKVNMLLSKQVPFSESLLTKIREQTTDMFLAVSEEMISYVAKKPDFVPTEAIEPTLNPTIPETKTDDSEPSTLTESPMTNVVFEPAPQGITETPEVQDGIDNTVVVEETNQDVSLQSELEVEVITEEAVEVVQETSTVPVVSQTSATSWNIDATKIICQKQEIVVTTKEGYELPIKLSISPLEVREGLVPLMVNAEYTNASIRQTSTFKSEEGESLLVIDIATHSFLLNGKFENGRFSVSIMTTGRSVENGDILRTESVVNNKGNAPAQRIDLCSDAVLWISFCENQYFGTLYSGEWIDEYNASHDVMIEQNGDYSELRLTKSNDHWELKF